MTARSFKVIFRNLMLFHNTHTALHVFVPSFKHRARLCDTWTGAQVPLSQSQVYLEVNGQRQTGGTPLKDPDNRVVTAEWLSLLPPGQFISAPKDIMDLTDIPESLCAHVTLGGGTLQAFPLSQFPEEADDCSHFQRRSKGPADPHKITDTLLYHLELPVGADAALIVTGPRRDSVRFDVSAGGRFEIYNEDDKLGDITTKAQQREDELKTILDLLNRGSISCDIHGCPGFYCGDPKCGDPLHDVHTVTKK